MYIHIERCIYIYICIYITYVYIYIYVYRLFYAVF